MSCVDISQIQCTTINQHGVGLVQRKHINTYTTCITNTFDEQLTTQSYVFLQTLHLLEMHLLKFHLLKMQSGSIHCE
jgi:hypothetical protein